MPKTNIQASARRGRRRLTGAEATEAGAEHGAAQRDLDAVLGQAPEDPREAGAEGVAHGQALAGAGLDGVEAGAVDDAAQVRRPPLARGDQPLALGVEPLRRKRRGARARRAGEDEHKDVQRHDVRATTTAAATATACTCRRSPKESGTGEKEGSEERAHRPRAVQPRQLVIQRHAPVRAPPDPRDMEGPQPGGHATRRVGPAIRQARLSAPASRGQGAQPDLGPHTSRDDPRIT